MKNPILKVLLFILSPIFLLAQPLPSSGPFGCNNAPILCSLNELNGFNTAVSSSIYEAIDSSWD